MDVGVSVEGVGVRDASTDVVVDKPGVSEDADTTIVGTKLDSEVEVDGKDAKSSIEPDAVNTAAASAYRQWNPVHVAERPLAGNTIVWHSGTSGSPLNASC